MKFEASRNSSDTERSLVDVLVLRYQIRMLLKPGGCFYGFIGFQLSKEFLPPTALDIIKEAIYNPWERDLTLKNP